MWACDDGVIDAFLQLRTQFTPEPKHGTRLCITGWTMAQSRIATLVRSEPFMHQDRTDLMRYGAGTDPSEEGAVYSFERTEKT